MNSISKSVVAMVIAASVAANFSSHAVAASPADDAVAHQIWSKLLTQCGVSYFYVNYQHDQGALYKTTMEYRQVHFATVLGTFSGADRLNIPGLTEHLYVEMEARLYRKAGETWKEHDFDPRDVAHMTDDDGIGALVGEFGFGLVKVNGNWYLSKESEYGSLAGVGKSLKDFIAAPHDRRSCS